MPHRQIASQPASRLSTSEKTSGVASVGYPAAHRGRSGAALLKQAGAEQEAVAVDDPDAGHSLRDKPSLAVLPFLNLSGDPEQEYFVDGMVEEINHRALAHSLAIRHRAQFELHL
jgi:hypothetical protein